MNNSFAKALKAVFAGTLMFVTWPNAMAQGDTQPTPTGVVVHGNVFGGGNQADVKINTEVNMSSGTVEGNVYGGGNLGSVGTYTTSADMKTFTFTANTGTCNVTIDNGSIGTGVSMSQDGTFANGNVYGAGKGEADTYWCEKAMVYKTNVTINGGTVNGTVYGGGQIGRVENDATVIIGVETPTNSTPAPIIAGNVFGAGAGKETHGYSALLRGDAKLTIQGNARVGLNVYGGGEEASVGRFKIVGGRPSEPDNDGSGDCTVNVRGGAVIGTNTDDNITDKGNVFGTCKGVAAPATFTAYDKEYKSMQAVVQKAPVGDSGTAWEYVEGSTDYYWEYYPTLDAYQGFLNTLALTSHPVVTIGGMLSNETTGAVIPSGNPTVNGSVYGGGQRGITLGTVAVNIAGGTVNQDVYGGGALADTNKGNQTAEKYDVAKVTVGETAVTGMYERSGAGTDESPYVYAVTEDTKAADDKTYYTKAAQSSINTTTVNLTGGTIKGDAYGGGLGQKTGFYDATSSIATKDVEAVVWGNINVNLGSSGGSSATSFYTTFDNAGTSETPVQVIKSGRVFGCNNLLGSPQGDVTVTVWRTVAGNGGTQVRTSAEVKAANKDIMDAHPDDYETVSGYVTPTYEVAAVYGGGNLAPYEAAGKKAHVIINGCDATSIQTVYGGGNAAPVPETDVDINSCYEIGAVFGGGNGKDKYKKGSTWETNPGANVNGNTNTLIYGGTVHEAYGASNEKGTIYGSVTIDIADNGLTSTDPGYCAPDVAKLVGAGKNADVYGDMKLIMGCKPSTKIPLVYGGADNANVNGDVELTVTSGNFGKVIGGNNNGGVIKGHIILNIEETTCTPIIIDHLYLCGYNAAYSQYGYYVKTDKTEAGTGIGDPDASGDKKETAILLDGKLQFIPRESATDSHKAVKTYSYNESGVPTWTVYSGEGEDKCEYAAPVLNVISCTSIGEVFGGGYGTGATVYGNPTVNINMIPGAYADKIDRDGDGNADNDVDALGTIGDVYGGGDAAAVYGNTTVNIGTATKVDVYEFAYDDVNKKYELQYETDGVTPKMIRNQDVAGAYITGNVYGGGKLADVGKYHEVDDPDPKWAGSKYIVVDKTGNTNVNICAKYNTESEKWESVAEGTEGITILGNVYGGGMGSDESFYCDKAMVLGNLGISQGGGTNVRIGNGTIKRVVRADGTVTGNVYGGGEIARVDNNTAVTIGYGAGDPTTPTSTPVIEGTVFGAGAGLRTHGYSALVRGHSSVTIEGNAKIEQSVYGGGELATVGRHYVVDGVAKDCISGGESTVIIGGYAEIGPDDMVMYNTTTGKPDDYGHVFGAGKGTQPYEGFADSEQPWSKIPNVYDEETGNLVTDRTLYKKFSALVGNEKLPNNYVTYLRTLALTTATEVTIKDHAFVKGSVFGGSENGFVLQNTQVTIQDNCQIGNGYVQMKDDGTYLATSSMRGVNRRYTDAEWSAGKLNTENDDTDFQTLVSANCPNSLPECASWPYGQAAVADRYAPYDKDANTAGDLTKYANGNSTEGGRAIGDDGHTFYGSVFGGGSGYYPYKPGRWFEDAGAVYGNTRVDITGGHILTSVYGGNEMTDVGKYQLDSDGKPTTKIISGGKCTITMTGGTIGVPRTLKQIGAHPVTCYLFGAGKGDQRVFFNKSTNVGDVELNVTGGTIYGSVFGGGEDGHVMRDVKITVENTTVEVPAVGESPATTTTITPTIGTWGTSYVDGNVFGGGRGFAGNAYTAGNVAGSVKMEIKGGNILGSVYGGGRLGSVGYGLFESTNTANYGVMQDDNKDDEGNPTNFYKEGDVGLGRGHIDITISGGTIGNNREYIIPNATNMAEAGIPEADRDISKWNDTNKYWDTWKTYHNIPKTEFDTTTGRVSHTKGGNVFAGGMGNFYKQDGKTPISDVNWWQLGCVKTTKVTISGGTIKSTVFGGGELGQVVGYHTAKNAANSNVNVGTEVIINGGTIGTELQESNVTRFIYGSVFGGGYGSLKETHGTASNVSYPKYIAGRVKAGTKVAMTAGEVRASVYGGGKMAAVGESKTLGETLTEGHTGDTHVMVSGGTIGEAPITLSDGSLRYFGGAKVGNVYGGGSGDNNTVRSGHVYGNTNVTISAGSVSGEPKIYHNVYGGGAYGSVGDFTYTLGDDLKVSGISNLHSDHTNSGVATVTITGGTIGTDGKENGMVFGSSRGDINRPLERDDYTAWVYDAHVIIGSSGQGTTLTTPLVKGSVYGSGENGHTYHDTEVIIHSGTIGITEDETDDNGTPEDLTDDITTPGAAYPYRGNVYGGGCGTDKYYSNHAEETHDGNGQLFNPLAGIVYGTTTVNINGGLVARNVYGAGAMGSVGRTVTTTTTEGETTTTTTTITGGTTTINVSEGTIGVDGTVGDGNVFGAARGDADAVSNEAALVRKETTVSVTGGTVKGNVYGGGELGCVGEYTISSDYRTFTWQDTDGVTNTDNNTKNTGICNVEIDGSSAVINGNVFGAGKGKDDTFWCEKGIAYSTNVNIKNGTVNGNVYGGGEVGRVETDSKVKIGNGAGTSGGASAPTIVGSVFGGGAGVETHGYSALVRGNTTVTVEGNATVGHSVYGGGEIASVGRYALDAQKMPSILQGGGYCYVTVQGNAQIGDDVFGAGKGVTPHFDKDNEDETKRSRRMTLKSDWESRVGADRFNWDYLGSESDYSTYLETLALATHPEVTIDGDASVSGSVFGGGELGLTKGSVIVNIQGGTITEDVYGGGSLANTNTTSSVDTTGDGQADTSVDPTTTVNLKGGTINRNVYGGGLGRLAKDAVAATPAQGTEGEDGYVPAVEAQPAVSAVEAKVYGTVLVKLNEPATTTTGEGEGATTTTTYGDCEVKGTIFGCNNLNGSPQKDVTVHIYKTVQKDNNGEVNDIKPTKNTNTYELEAVYGGGNLAAYYPDGATTSSTAKANVIIDGCNLTSIGSVYGGGNAASVPATKVTVNGTWEIGEAFGGGNGKDNYQLDGIWYKNPGANVGLKNYTHWNTASVPSPGTEDKPYYLAEDNTNPDTSTRENRSNNYGYGTGKAYIEIYGGTVHKVYGGSNTKGNVREESRTKLEDLGCDYTVDEAYGGGNNAPQDGDAVLEVGCINGLDIAYGGASDADVNGNVILNITNGTYGRVFGGNNLGGAIRGSIMVNIEETGCNPIIIGELYGGGNEAPYSVYGYELDAHGKPQPLTSLPSGGTKQADPVVNVKSFTSIGKIFGGGYGAPATMVGNPEVNVNVVKGRYRDTEIGEGARVIGSTKKETTDEGYDATKGFDIPSHEAGAIGAIGSVYGGGNKAEVIGNPTVNIGTEAGDEVYDPVTATITPGTTSVADYYTFTAASYSPATGTAVEGTKYYSKSGDEYVEATVSVGDDVTSYYIRTEASYSPASGTAVEGTTYFEKKTVAVDIRGNVFGGGNNAEVTGNTNVVIGKKTTTTTP